MEFFRFFDAFAGVAYSIAYSSVAMRGGELLDVAKPYLKGLWISLVLAFAVYLLFVVLGGIGLSRMAKKEHKKYAFLGFIPILNTWYAGYIAGKANFFGQKMKRAGLYAAILETVYIAVCALDVLSEFLIYMHPMVRSGLDYSGLDVSYITANVGELPVWLRWLFGTQGQVWLGIVNITFFIALIAFLAVIYIALFRKYFARSPLLMTLLCVLFPFRGAVLCAVRNNDPVDYNEYLRKRMEMRRRRYTPYGGQGTPYGGQGNPYGGQGNPYGGQPKEPFSDFGGNGGGQNGGQNGGKGTGDPPSDNPFSDFD